MAAAEVITEAREINGLQHGYVHTKAVPVPESASTMSRTLPQSIPTNVNEKIETSPASSKSKHSTQLSTSDGSQFTNSGQKDWSPPSTVFSSQEQLPVKDAQEAAEPSGQTLDHAITQEPLQSTSTRGSTGSPSRADASRDVITERKRTASGQSKRASISSIQDLRVESSPGRSRTSTLLSNTSSGSLMELSQQLRTRLTYAMVKVQNGWQTRSLDEVESLASQSPRSTVSGFPRNPLHSPRSVMSGNLQRTWSSSDSSEDGPVAQLRAAAYGNAMQAPQLKRGLAPPADIISGSRRRPPPNANGFTQGLLHSPSKHRHAVRPAPKLRTPSQTAAQEADAVETLLFMASPGNSQHHPPIFTPVESSLRSAQLVSSQMSPLRDHFDHNGQLLSPKKVTFDASGIPNSQLISRTVQIERMLDESDDEDDSNELDHAIQIGAMARATGPVRGDFAAGNDCNLDQH